MNQLSIIQALTGVIPGEGASGNGGQGILQGNPGISGSGLFGDLLGQELGQQLSGAALKLQQIRAGQTGVALDANGLILNTGEQTSPDGASALLQISAGEAAEITAQPEGLTNTEGTDGQVLFGLINHAANNAAIENSAVLAAALAEDGETGTFAAGSNQQTIPAPFQGLSTVSGETAGEAPEGALSLLPTQADDKALLASGKDNTPAITLAASSASGGIVEIAASVAPGSADISAAVKSVSPAEAPASPQNIATRSDIAAAEAQKSLRVEGDNQSRAQASLKATGAAQAGIEGDADDSGGFDRNGKQNADQNGNQSEHAGKKNAAALLQASSATGPGVKTSLGGDSSAAMTLPQVQSESPSSVLQSQLTPLRALENSMAFQSGLFPAFDSAPVDPMTGMQTSPSAPPLAAATQANQATASITSPATSATSFAHAPNYVAHQVGLQITRAVADGQNEFTIRLNPPEMGRIDVRLEFQADGGVRAALSAEKPETLNLMQRDAAALERTLNEAGIKADSGSLNFSLQQDEAHGRDDAANGAGKSAQAGEETGNDNLPTEETEITEQVLQQMVADGAVDIHV